MAAMAAILSTLDAAVNTGALCLARDVYQQIFPRSSGRRLVAAGRWSTLVVGGAALAVAFRFQDILKTLGLASQIMAAGLFIPGMAMLFLKKTLPAAGLLSLLLGGGFSLLSFFANAGIVHLSLPDWPRSVPSGMALSAAGFIIGTGISILREKRRNPWPSRPNRSFPGPEIVPQGLGRGNGRSLGLPPRLRGSDKNGDTYPRYVSRSLVEVAHPRSVLRDGMVYRRLGRTGLQISEISLGGSPLPDERLLFQLIERGINYIDTSDSYENGNCERKVGRLFKAFGRDKIYIHARFHLEGRWTEASIIASVEGSLSRLATDQAEILGIHGVENPDHLTDERILGAFEKLQAQGKCRFRGLTCHVNQHAVIPKAVDSGLYDMVQIGYNVFDIQETEKDDQDLQRLPGRERHPQAHRTRPWPRRRRHGDESPQGRRAASGPAADRTEGSSLIRP